MGTRVMTVAEAAEALKVEKTTIYRLINKGELSAIDLSVEGKQSAKGLTRLLEDEVEAFITRRTRNAKTLRRDEIPA